MTIERWPMRFPVRISGHTFRESQVVVATLCDGTFTGRGEAVGVYYLNDTPPAIVAQIESIRATIEGGVSRSMLIALLPPGGARNALDCALWDLESKQREIPVWQLAQVSKPSPLKTTCTLSADSPGTMADGARNRYRDAIAIKIKLLGDAQDAARVDAVRAARSDIWLGVDANQGFTLETLEALLPTLIDARVALIEQPFKIGEESRLDGLQSPIPIAADESVQSLKDVAGLVGRFDVMNIKLDKCGGLTEGLMMAQEGRRLGLKIMVGNMGGTSLSMAPATLLGPYCDVVDLDGPLFLASDRAPSVVYDHGHLVVTDGLWGWSPGNDRG